MGADSECTYLLSPMLAPKHETSHAGTEVRDEYWDWWEGCRWEADVEEDGRVGPVRSVAGGIAEFSRAQTGNPVAEAMDE